MKDFFVEQILDGFLITAFPVAVIAGLISFLSPCVLPLVPGYLSFASASLFGSHPAPYWPG